MITNYAGLGENNGFTEIVNSLVIVVFLIGMVASNLDPRRELYGGRGSRHLYNVFHPPSP